jgi:hypothetical protein
MFDEIREKGEITFERKGFGRLIFRFLISFDRT